MDTSNALVWGYGGGVQTAAIAVLVHRGQLPKPDIAVMADTDREATETWEYLDGVMRPYLREVGIEVEMASHALATKDLYGGEDGNSLLIPAFTAEGKGQSYCSGEWKRDVIRRYLRSRSVQRCTYWLGFSSDEVRRCHESNRGWIRHEFPLIEKRISRAGCELLVEQEGLPPAPKSSCYMCPHRSDWQWLRLREHYPEDWEAACELDRAIRNRGNGPFYISSQRVPLTEAKIDGATKPTEEPSLFRACESGYCWV